MKGLEAMVRRRDMFSLESRPVGEAMRKWHGLKPMFLTDKAIYEITWSGHGGHSRDGREMK